MIFKKSTNFNHNYIYGGYIYIVIYDCAQRFVKVRMCFLAMAP